MSEVFLHYFTLFEGFPYPKKKTLTSSPQAGIGLELLDAQITHRPIVGAETDTRHGEVISTNINSIIHQESRVF